MWKPPWHQSTLWRPWHWDSWRCTPILAVCPSAKASAVLSWAAWGKPLPAAPGGDPAPWLSTAQPGGLCALLAPQARRGVDVLEGGAESHRDGEGVGQLYNEWKLRKLSQFSLQGRRLGGVILFLICAESNYHKEGCNEGGAGLFAVGPEAQLETVGTEWNPEGSFWTSQTTYLLWDCPWRSWTLHPWSYSKATWLWIALLEQWRLHRVTSGCSFHP